ncbi:hypothetical protein CALVIDRAFT_168761 [Calocera viscosa TUFC12733]|uniref:Tim44-like domain-containing protein n=1 Tax=Calocera viscosa (strain TUFC12733) TaxID=1330018 RepID=A0A167L6I1_CALVF|nr:hypothetical protein CALVIDRAFT_168761 [Calocera viscosa TUFC12733]
MSLALHRFSPACRRTCLQRLPGVRQYAAGAASAASKSAARSAAKSAASSSKNSAAAQRIADVQRKREELEEERRRGEISQRRNNPFSDPLNTAVSLPLLSVVPPVSWSTLKGVWPRGRVWWVWDRIVNSFTNAVTLLWMARGQHLPLIHPSKQPASFREIYLAWLDRSPNRLRWLGALRKEASDLYLKVNEAIASGDKHKTLVSLCQNDYHDLAVRRARAHGPDTVLEWRFHGEASPTRIISIREGSVPIGSGTLFLTHALVRFDTMQSLRVTKVPSQKKGRQAIALTPPKPAVPKRVVEYLVLEGREYDDRVQWRFKAQLFDERSPYMRDKYVRKKWW